MLRKCWYLTRRGVMSCMIWAMTKCVRRKVDLGSSMFYRSSSCSRGWLLSCCHGFSEAQASRGAGAHTLGMSVIMSRTCDNPDCYGIVDSVRGSYTRLAKSIFCSAKCKQEFVLWVIAVDACWASQPRAVLGVDR